MEPTMRAQRGIVGTVSTDEQGECLGACPRGISQKLPTVGY